MLNPQEMLKKDIEKIEDDEIIEKISIFVMGLQAGTHGKAVLPPPNSPPPALPPAG